MPPKTLMTAAEFAQTGAETDGYELVRGELSPMPPPGDLHGLIVMNIGFLLNTYTLQVGRGYVIGSDAGLVTEQDPDTVRGVDVMLFLESKWDSGVPEGYSRVPPDLCVEVRSPSQSWKEMMEKVLEYLNMGVRMVWIVDQRVRRVTIFTPDTEPQTLATENDIAGGDILPGFRCKVAQLFRGM